MGEYKKVPLGVAPHWFVYNKRIKDLNEAIARYIDFSMENSLTSDTAQYYELISKWATEIKELAETEAELLKGEQNGRT